MGIFVDKIVVHSLPERISIHTVLRRMFLINFTTLNTHNLQIRQNELAEEIKTMWDEVHLIPIMLSEAEDVLEILQCSYTREIYIAKLLLNYKKVVIAIIHWKLNIIE